MPFRKIVFWAHLISGSVFGVVVGIMSVTGVAVAFEEELVSWAERDARRVAPPAPGAQPLSLDELVQAAREQRPDVAFSGIQINASPEEVYILQAGRRESYYADPYTGEVRDPGAAGLRSFMQTMVEWHRWLGAKGENRGIGRAITGISNLAFLALLLTGLYIWIPRRWSRRALRLSLWFTRGARGKTRDWNWHNVVGFWTAPVLLVLIVSGVVISYPWASNLVYRAVGEEPPPPRRGPPTAGKGVATLPEPPDGAAPLGMDELMRHAQTLAPQWEEISLQIPKEPDASARASAAVFTVRNRDRFPVFSSNRLQLDPYTGKLLASSNFSDQSTGRKARSWLRFLHTGEAFGLAGKIIATIASGGGAILVYTGFALAIRRFIRWRGRGQNRRSSKEPAPTAITAER